jgi:tetratricopeptide (TPR) repeat protein
MPILSAQNNFKRGLAALLDDNARDAVVFFRRALEIENQRGPGSTGSRCLSYYGLSLALLSPNHPEALDACRRATERSATDPDLFLNLGRVCRLARRRIEALRAFQQGLEISPSHPVLQRELNDLDRRRPPVVRRLERDHPVNVWLGRLRAHWAAGEPKTVNPRSSLSSI